MQLGHGCRLMKRTTSNRGVGPRVERTLLAVLTLLAALGLAACNRAPQQAAHPEPRILSPGHSGVLSGVPGRWARLRVTEPGAELSPEQSRAIAKLQSLGYVSGSRQRVTDQTITVHQRDTASAGWNFYVSSHSPEATLMDMDGNVVHRWNLSARQAWPALPDENIPYHSKDFWRRAVLFPNGDVIANFEALGLVKVDKDSQLIWSVLNLAHHDLDVAPNGDIYVLTQAFRVVKEADSGPVVEDSLSVLDANGQEKRRISLLQCVVKLVHELGVDLPIDLGREVTHANTVEVLDGSAEHLSPAFKAGNVLVSLRSLNLLAVLDMDSEQFVWHLASGYPLAGGVTEKSGLFFCGQHEPTLLPNGHMLLFDNQGIQGESTVWEFDPITREVFWKYRGDRHHPFYSAICGTAQRLPNGNTLITESDNGRVFEVTREHEIVWEFFNPHRAGEQGEFIAMVAELVRLAPDFPTDWIHTSEELARP